MQWVRNPSFRLQQLAAALRESIARANSFIYSHKFQLAGLILLSSSAFLSRFIVVAQGITPAGADYGNYLTNLHAFLGNDVTGEGVQYPTIFLTYLWGITTLFGELWGLKISGPLLVAALALPSYLLLRLYVRPAFALLGSAFIVFAEGFSEMIGWGGNANVLGMIFGIFFVAFLGRYVRWGRLRDLILGGVAFGLLAGSHQVSVVYFGFVAVFAIALLGVIHRDRQGTARGLQILGAGVLASIVFVPFYLQFATLAANTLPTRLILLTFDEIIFLTGWIFREMLVLWVPILIVAILGYRWLRRAGDRLGWSLGVALLVSPPLLAATVLILHPVRPLYFLYFGMIPGAMVFLQRVWSMAGRTPVSIPSTRNVLMLGASVVLALTMILAFTSHQRMIQAVQWYTVVDDEVLDGLTWIESNTPLGSVIATTGPSRYGAEVLAGCTWGWWVEGLGQRKSLCSGDPASLALQSQVARTREANRAFSGPLSMENGWVRVGEYAPFGSRGNPIIYAESGRGYQALVYFNDAETELKWVPSGDTTMRIDAPYYLPSRSVGISSTDEFGEIRYVAESGSLYTRRDVQFASGSSTVWVNYTFSMSGVLQAVSIPVMSTSLSRLNNFDMATRTLSVGHDPTFRESIGALVSIVREGDSLVDVEYNTNPQAPMPQVRFIFAPGVEHFEVSFAVLVSFSPEAQASRVQTAEAMSIFALAQVEYVFVDKLKIREIEWFDNDSEHFQVAYQNFAVAVYEVMWPAG